MLSLNLDKLRQWWRNRSRKMDVEETDGVIAEPFKNGIVAAAATALPVMCAVVATLAAGYFFNSGRDFDGSTQAVVAYGLAAITEFAMLAAFIVSANAFWHGRTWQFVLAMAFGLLLMIVSTVAQVLYLSTHIDTQSADAAASTVSHFPILSFIFGGTGGGAWVIMTRAAVVGVVELGCSFVLARVTVSHSKKMTRSMEKGMERMLHEQFARMLEGARRQHERNMAELDMLEEFRDMMVQGGRDDMMSSFRGRGKGNTPENISTITKGKKDGTANAGSN